MKRKVAGIQIPVNDQCFNNVMATYQRPACIQSLMQITGKLTLGSGRLLKTL